MTIDMATLARDIYKLATYIDEGGNRGIYRSTRVEWMYVLSPKWAEYRKDILYYSKGHGWRVRKKPHWRTVYDQRFKQWYQPPVTSN